MGTRLHPGVFDCAAKAEDDEPTFTLLARDSCAASTVRRWAGVRLRTAKNKITDKQIEEAYLLADAMDAWRAKRRTVVG